MKVCFGCDRAITSGYEHTIYEASSDPDYWAQVCAALRALERLERRDPVEGLICCEVCGDIGGGVRAYSP